MNLCGDGWIPVVYSDGRHREVSLEEVFRDGHLIRDLTTTPPQRIALARLLLCVAQAGLDGPTDEDDWCNCKKRIARAALDYLKAQWQSFDLFGKPGFLQVPNLQRTDVAIVDRLELGLAANSPTLFDHEAAADPRPRPTAWCALRLLTCQCFSPGGTIGQAKWKGVETSKSSNHAPCLEGTALHTILRGKTLLDTIHLNLLTKETIRRLPNTTWGRPVWEDMPKGPGATSAATNATKTYLGRLVPLARAVALNPQSPTITLVNGLSYPKLSDGYREPSATVVKVKVKKGASESIAYVRVDIRKHPWRELASLLSLSSSNREGGALALEHLQRVNPKETVDLWTGGLASGQAKIIDVAEWSFSIEARALDSTALRKYQTGVKLADQASVRLRSAVQACLADLNVPELKKGDGGVWARNDKRSRQQREKILATAGMLFWGRLDASYPTLLAVALDPKKSLDEDWYRTVLKAMHESFRTACSHDTPRQIRAFAKGSEKLRLRKTETSAQPAREPQAASPTSPASSM